MTTPVGPPNFDQLRKTIVGAEVIRGTKPTMTNKWYGMLDLVRHQSLAESNDFDGTFFGDRDPTRGAVTVDGTYAQKMSYEDPQVFRYCMKGGVTPVTDGNATPGYTSTFRHTGSRDDLDTFASENGDPVMIYDSTGIFFPEFTISSDIDDAEAVWKFNAKAIGIDHDLKDGLDDVAATSGSTTTFVKTSWGLTIDARIGAWVHFKSGTAGNIGLWREVLDNDATTLTFAALPSAVASGDTIDVYPVYTSGISDRVRELIKGPGTKLYLANAGDTIGASHLVSGRFISFSVTSILNASYKRFMENVDTMSNRTDRGKIRVTGQIRLEMDRKREWDKWKALSPEVIRIAQTGSVIDSGAGTTKSATIDIYNAAWDDPVPDKRGNNKTATWPFVGFVDATEAVPLQIAIKNRQSALLA